MNLKSIPLQLFVRDSISPQKLVNQTISPEEFNKWKSFLVNEIESFKLSISDWSWVDHEKDQQQIMALLSQVVNLSNILNSYIHKEFILLKDHPQAAQIKSHYSFSIILFEDLLSSLSLVFPVEAGKIPITNYALPQVLQRLKQQHKLLSGHLNNDTIDSELKEVALRGTSQLIKKKNLTGNEADYVRTLMSVLLKETAIDNQKLLDLLITHDFNVPEFFLYCVNLWRTRLGEIPGLHEQREMLLLEKDRIYNLFIERGFRIPVNSSNLYSELDQFLNEKYSFIKQMVKIRRELITDNEKAKASTRFLINLPVPQFGLFIRMQIEKGLLGKEHIGELFSFFATHFYTPNALYISADSLQKKSTDVEFATAQKLKGHLIGMLNWLNTNYNLSNYN